MENLTTANANANAHKINHLVVDYSNNDYFAIHVSHDNANGYWINPESPDDDDYTWGVIAENIADLITHNTTGDYTDRGIITITADDVVVATISGVDVDDDVRDDAVATIGAYIYATVMGVDVDDVISNQN